MNKREICEQLKKVEIPGSIVALWGSLKVDPVDIPITELVEFDPLGGIVVIGSVSLYALQRKCSELEEVQEEKDEKENAELSEFDVKDNS